MGMDRLSNQVAKEGRDLAILVAVVDHGPIGIVRLAEETGLPEHKVRYSLRMLENDGLVEPTPEGAVPSDGIGDHLVGINDGIDELADRLEEMKGIYAESSDG